MPFRTMRTPTYYAVAKGRIPGVYTTWPACHEQIHKVSGAKYKKCSSWEDARAFIHNNESDPVPLDVTEFEDLLVPEKLSDHTRPASSKRNRTLSANRTSKSFGTRHTNLPPTSGTFQSSSTTICSDAEQSECECEYVYTDGSCVNNGRPNARAGIGVFFGVGDKRNVSKRVVGKQSNNTAEIAAILCAYDQLAPDLLVSPDKCYVIVTDSEYAIRCASSYGQKQAASGWTSTIPNKPLVRQLYDTISGDTRVKLMKVAAHTGRKDTHSVGNEHADRLANEAIGTRQTRVASGNGTVRSTIQKTYHRDSGRTYLYVQYKNKDDAKGKGARWDPSKKRWYVQKQSPHHDVLVEMYGSLQ